MSDHDHGPPPQTVNLVISFDPNAQDLLNAIVMTLQAQRVFPKDLEALNGVKRSISALLQKAQAISTTPPTKE